MALLHILSVLLFCLSVIECQNGDPTVTLPDGEVKGSLYRTAFKGTPFYAFKGIPYAQPPVGKLRFEPPVKNLKWNGTWDGTKEGKQCIQDDPDPGFEDCLYINVYTPSLQRENLSVVVFVHGEVFIQGNSSYVAQPPDLFLEENIVFVMFNYRLGVFGFLSTEDLTVPGNNALKDQLLALKWVNRNIHHFGGNPEAVTLFGQSAGAASVAYLIQSPSSKGLFKAAILNSGSSLCLWALNRRARKTAFKIGQNLNVDTYTTFTLIDGLKTVDALKLQKAATTVSNAVVLENPLAGIMFGPVIEEYHEGAYIYNKSEALLSTGEFNRVPVLIGINSNEALAADYLSALLRLFVVKYDLNLPLLAPEDLTNSTKARRSAAEMVKSHFFNNLPMVTARSKKIAKYIGTDQFVRPIIRTAMDMKKYVDVYFYQFSYEGFLGRRTESIKPVPGEGVGHAEDLGYLFTKPVGGNIPENDRLIQQRMVRMWSNFVKHNNPTPTKDSVLQNITWLPNTPSSGDDLIYLNIDVNMTINKNPFEEDIKFYDSVYEKYGTPPYDTY